MNQSVILDQYKKLGYNVKVSDYPGIPKLTLIHVFKDEQHFRAVIPYDSYESIEELNMLVDRIIAEYFEKEID